MTIAQHPLANGELGDFHHHVVLNLAEANEQANWTTIFYYIKGRVTMQVLNNAYKYTTVMNVLAKDLTK